MYSISQSRELLHCTMLCFVSRYKSFQYYDVFLKALYMLVGLSPGRSVTIKYLCLEVMSSYVFHKGCV